jgi:hypothetical protein
LARSWDFEIGFVWLCFLEASDKAVLDNPLQVKSLHLFGLLQIGFVFSNRPV